MSPLFAKVLFNFIRVYVEKSLYYDNMLIGSVLNNLGRFKKGPSVKMVPQLQCLTLYEDQTQCCWFKKSRTKLCSKFQLRFLPICGLW